MPGKKLFTCESTWACAPATTRGRSTQLSAHPKGTHFVYTNGRSVVIRDLKHPEISDIYNEHSSPVTVAKYAPSGFYIASADVNGNIRIWDTINKEHVLKAEYQKVIASPVDLDWDFESKRIVVAGDGREVMAQPFVMDSGASVGTIGGHSKCINSVSLRPSRPFRAATGGDDNLICFHKGVPFEFVSTSRGHSRFVTSVRYAPAGTQDVYASAGMDGLVFLYDGKEGSEKSKLTVSKSAIYALSWASDGKQFMTSSGDRHVRIWDASTNQSVMELEIGSETIGDQQVGNLWAGDWCISLGLNGKLNYIDPREGKVTRVVEGHQKSITAINRVEDRLYTAGYDGLTLCWDMKSGMATRIGGSAHKTQVLSLSTPPGSKNTVFSLGLDDVIRRIGDMSFEDVDPIQTDPAPKGMAAMGQDKVVYGTSESVIIVEKGKQVRKIPCPGVTCVDYAEGVVAVGRGDNKVILFDENLAEKAVISDHRSGLTCVSLSKDGKYVASGDLGRQILVHETFGSFSMVVSQWSFHNARVNAVSWSDSGERAVSGGIDTDLYVWSRPSPMTRSKVGNAHLEGVNQVAFWGENKVVSAGQDSCVRVWVGE